MAYNPLLSKQERATVPINEELREWFNKTEGATCYRKKMKAYIPIGKNVNGKVKPCMTGVNQFIKDVNKIFKGSTVYDAWGSWYDAGYCSKSDIYNRRDCTKAGAKWTVVDKVESEKIKVVEIGYGKRGQTCLEREQKLDYIQALSRYGNTCNQYQMAITDDGEFFMGDTQALIESKIKVGIEPRRRIRRR